MIRNLIAALMGFVLGSGKSRAEAPTPNADSENEPWVDKLQWLPENHDNNPFNEEVLDCRTVALGFTSTTSDPAIATAFVNSRNDDGRSYIGKLPENVYSIDSEIRFPYNGNREDGVIYFAKEMEDKWDFYAYDSKLYIRRSWTGVLLHVLELRYTDTEVIVVKIHSEGNTVYRDSDYTKAHVNFLINTHFAEKVIPFPTPPVFTRETKKAIALSGFNSYGRRAQFGAIPKLPIEQGGDTKTDPPS